MEPLVVSFKDKIYLIAAWTYEVFDLKNRSFKAKWEFTHCQVSFFTAAVMNRTIVSARHGRF